MNLFLHNIGDKESHNFTSPADVVIADLSVLYDYLLANPPFDNKAVAVVYNNIDRLQETLRL